MFKTFATIAAVAALSVASIAPAHALITGNGLDWNALTENGLDSNALTQNGLNAGGSALTIQAIELPPETR